MPAKTPPASAVKVTEPFITPKPVYQPVVTTDQAHDAQHDRHRSVEFHQPANQPFTNQTPVVSHQFPGPSRLHTIQDTDMDLDSYSDVDPVHQRTSVFDEEGKLSDPDHDRKNSLLESVHRSSGMEYTQAQTNLLDQCHSEAILVTVELYDHRLVHPCTSISSTQQGYIEEMGEVGSRVFLHM